MADADLDNLEDDEDGAEEEEMSEQIIIIDNGTGVCKAGMSTDETPQHIFPEIVGKLRKGQEAPDSKAYYFGEEVNQLRGKLKSTFPIESGIIENFEHMELLWEYTFCERLQVDPAQHAVMLTEPPYNPNPNREKIVEIMFETFGVPMLNISLQGVLALLGQGRTSGLVVDSGEGVTHTMPIYEGYGIPHCVNRIDVAGRELNTLLAKLLACEGTSLCTSQEQHHVRLMKEQHCYVSLDPSKEFAEPATYRLPDGRDIKLADERWKCPEALFNPAIIGLESYGVAGIVWKSISDSEIDMRKTLQSNIVVSGGSTMFEGFRQRLKKELQLLAPTASQSSLKVLEVKTPQYAVWTGAQVSASLKNLQEDTWMAMEDYDEYGASFIHDKVALKYK
eukprot:TRINITY_DN102239_c0_g1_i1.p1 TRINITY_DN102239_c0_g1~~TRINITY_DN102239_c0_g1_i1.p1  ORF type:complete len:392 (+),score=121.00 TRINITY_DN102239_c0_g1_i1:76-1251(+)